MTAAAATSGLYLHVPFCEARCSYCAFATWVDRAERVGDYFTALRAEIRARCRGATFDTIYFGGGTPSLPDPRELAATLAAIREVATVARGAEVTLEANPESVSGARAEAWLEAGFNRVSVGAQSFDAGVLAAAGRLHGPEATVVAVRALRAAGFGNLSLDLLAGLPEESAVSARDSRRRALDLEPEHLSLYLLELDEAGKTTPLSVAVRAGRTVAASDDELADRYEETCADMEAAGLPLYEISNFARPGFESRHNLKYWLCEPVIGCGVAAHGLDRDGRRPFNVGLFEAYLSAAVGSEGPESPESRHAPGGDLAAERIVLGLRLAAGVDLARLEDAHPGAHARFQPALDEHAACGLVELAGGRARLTPRGRLLSNEVFRDLAAA